MQLPQPITFIISNPVMVRKSYCGILEFTSEPDTCILPAWLMTNLLLEDGNEIYIRSCSLRNGTFIKLQPHDTAFINLPEIIGILERELSNYATLLQGETISIYNEGNDYLFDVLECQPDNQVCLGEAAIDLAIELPKDSYKNTPEDDETPSDAFKVSFVESVVTPASDDSYENIYVE